VRSTIVAAVAVFLISSVPASAQYAYAYYPHGAPWCAYGFFCSYLTHSDCASSISGPPGDCTKNPYFLAAYPTPRIAFHRGGYSRN
jgi:hypothetical protein